MFSVESHPKLKILPGIFLHLFSLNSHAVRQPHVPTNTGCSGGSRPGFHSALQPLCKPGTFPQHSAPPRKWEQLQNMLQEILWEVSVYRALTQNLTSNAGHWWSLVLILKNSISQMRATAVTLRYGGDPYKSQTIRKSSSRFLKITCCTCLRRSFLLFFGGEKRKKIKEKRAISGLDVTSRSYFLKSCFSGSVNFSCQWPDSKCFRLFNT